MSKKKIAYDQLVKLDGQYFRDDEGWRSDHPEEFTDEEAAHRLATWLFDNEGDEARLRKKVKEHLPDVYVQMLECFVDGNHDT